MKQPKIEALLTLTPRQDHILQQSLDGETTDYAELIQMELEGKLDHERFCRAWQEVVQQRSEMRTAFVWKRIAKPHQVIFAEVTQEPQSEDFTASSPEQIESWYAALEQTPIKLTKAPVGQVYLLRLGEHRHRLVWRYHSLNFDPPGAAAILRRVAACYAGRELAKVPAFAQYVGTLKNHRDTAPNGFWAKMLAGFEHPNPLGLARPEQAATRSREYLELPMTSQDSARHTAAWLLLLAHYSGERAVTVGVVRDARKMAKEFAQTPGNFQTILPLRIHLDTRKTIGDLLDELKRRFRIFDENAQLSEHNVRELAGLAVKGPLFETVVESTEEPSLEMDGVTVITTTHRRSRETPVFLTVRPTTVGLDYDRQRFDSRDMRLLLERFCHMLEQTERADQRLLQVSVLGEAQQQMVLETLNQTQLDRDTGALLHRLFEAQVKRTPEADALITAELALSYDALNRKANRIARHLRAQVGTGFFFAGLHGRRKADLIVCMLAILKAGGAYVPLDPEYPEDRIGHMLSDSGAPFTFSDGETVPGKHQTQVLPMKMDDPCYADYAEDDLKDSVPELQLAYTIYTSGSTGVPKGVAISHFAAAAMVAWAHERYPLTELAVVAGTTSICFDLSVYEIFVPITRGGALFLAENAFELAELPGAERITLLNTVPSVMTELVRAGTVPPKIAVVNLAGEPIRAELVAEIYRLGHVSSVYNLYGPSEDTTYSTWARLEANKGIPPIGKPIGNTQAYVLDPWLRPLGIGNAGELYLGGQGVTRGYLNRPAQTAERYLPDPFGTNPGARLYQTGDLVRWNHDGELMFLGRVDHQVKVRGFRIELGEIETALSANPLVSECVVVTRDDGPGGKCIVAYVVPVTGKPFEENVLREDLEAHLPDFMIPAAFVALEALPLTPNRKVDRSALPAPQWGKADSELPFVAPRNEAETILARVWCDVLGLEQVSVEQNFFHLGGDSILSIQVIARANQAGLRLQPRDFIRHHTVAALAARAGQAGQVQAEQEPVDRAASLTPIQAWFFEQELARPHHWNQSLMLQVAARFDGEQVHAAAFALWQHHDSLRLRFEIVDGQLRTQGTAPETSLFTSAWTRHELTGVAPSEQAAEITRLASEAQASLDLEKGPIARFVYFDLGSDQPGRILLAFHHLVVDGVSWRFLLEDLMLALQQASQKQQIQLPPKTTSYAAWSEALQRLAAGDEPRIHVNYWLDQAARLDRQVQIPTVEAGEGGSLFTELDEAATSALVDRLPASCRTNVTEVLLCALAAATCETFGPGSLVVDLEGHGRTELFDDVSIGRTVGWFTAMLPIVLNHDPETTALDRLKLVKETARRASEAGIYYGAARYLSPDTELRERLAGLPPADVSLNYLGRLDRGIALTEAELSPAPEDAGPMRAPENQPCHLLEIDASQVGKGLRIGWTYSAELAREQVEQLSRCFHEQLSRLLSEIDRDGVFAYTPMDFPLCHLDQQQLDQMIGKVPGIAELYPATPLQQGMLFHSHLEEGSGEYVVQVGFTLGLDQPEDFREAWNQILRRHDILRTWFARSQKDGRLFQVVMQTPGTHWQTIDWRGEADQAGKIAELREQERATAFEPGTPPMRLLLVRLADDEYEFLWSHHHALLDGWSMRQVLGEVFGAYRQIRRGEQVVFPSVAPFGDYVRWLHAGDMAEAENYWRDALSGFEEVTPLYLARPEQPVPPGEVELSLSPEVTRALEKRTREQGITLNVMLQASWAHLLGRYSGERDVVHGTTVSGRPGDLPGVEQMVGLFINTLPVRTRLPRRGTLADWLRDIHEQHQQMRAHEFTPLVRIQTLAEVPAGMPLFQTLLVFENYPSGNPGENGDDSLRVSGVFGQEQTNFPLTVIGTPGEAMSIKVMYDGTTIGAEEARRIAGHVCGVLTIMAEGLGQSIASLTRVTQPSREWNEIPGGYPEQPVQRIFEDIAQRYPEKIALRDERETLTYAELDREANRLAHHLRGLGLLPGQTVGLFGQRTNQTLVALLATLKAGGVYVPIDPEYPAERIAFIIEDTEPVTILSETGLMDRLPDGLSAIAMDTLNLTGQASERLELEVPHTAPAYIIFTSGSTGRPKGVSVPHRAIARLVCETNYLTITPEDVFCQAAPLSFDAATLEIWGPWLNGAQLVLPKPGKLSLEELGELLREQGVTIMWLTSGLFNLMVDHHLETLAGIRYLLVGGDVVSVPHVAKAQTLTGVQLINGYGPTENTTFTCCHAIEPIREKQTSISIGRPIRHTTVHVLDGELRPLDTGLPGQLVTGGHGLALGYHKRPSLTAERFVPDPFGKEPGARLYLTGDRVRWAENGTVDFLGRVDHQVKIRGFRIELEEIEVTLLAHPQVNSCVVVVREDAGEKRIVGYVTPNEGATLAGGEARDWLAARIPEFMVPAHVIVLETMPLTPNGKVDRRALPAPELGGASELRGGDPTADLMLDLWADVLKLECVAPTDNFFDLGGHSLLATQLVSRIKETFGVVVPLRILFERANARALTDWLNSQLRGDSEEHPIVPVPRDAHLPLSFAQQRLWIIDRMQGGKAVYNIPSAVRIRGPLDTAVLQRVMDEILRRHEVLRTAYQLEGEDPIQVIQPAEPVTIETHDYRNLAQSEREKAGLALANQIAARPFDLQQPPMFTIALARLDEEEHIAVLNFHHIATDGWSTGVFLRELGALYQAYSRDQPSPLRELAIQYADFASWQRNYMSGKVLEEHLQYWHGQLGGQLPELELPTDFPRPPQTTYRGDHYQHTLTGELVTQLERLARDENASLFMVLLAAWKVLLNRVSGQTDILLGTDVANRNRSELEPLIGFFVNVLALRTDLSGNPTFREIIGRVRTTALGAYAHQDLPFDRLVESMRIARANDKNPIVQSLFVFQNLPMPANDKAELQLEPITVPTKVSRFDMAVFVVRVGESLVLSCDYATDLFKPETIENMMRRFQFVLETVVANTELRLSQIGLEKKEKREKTMTRKVRKKSYMDKLKTIKPVAVDVATQAQVTSSYPEGGKLPLIMSPASPDVDAIEWARNHRDDIEKEVLKHGAVLFRGFGFDVPGFERFAEAIQPDLFAEYGDLPREGQSKRIYKSTPYPNNMAILHHSESSHLKRWPRKIFFHCVKVAETGGNTPIIDCRKLYRVMDPEIREQFETKGLMYQRNFGKSLDVSWQQFFQTEDPKEVEARCEKDDIQYEWKGEGGLRICQVRPAIATHPVNGQKVFFNQIFLFHNACILDEETRTSMNKVFSVEELPRHIYFGDGSPISDETVRYLLDLYETHQVSLPWQQGDIMMLDNMLAAHARSPFEGERKIVVAMGAIVEG